MTYQLLHFDAKLSIARTSISTWNAIMRADPIFGHYALSDAGRSTFIAAFTVVEGGDWRVGGKLHRIDTPGMPGSGGPARTFANGSEGWYEHGQLHRIGGPARTWSNGTKWWIERGKLHRIGGPAIIYPNGTEFWYEHDQLHRIGGPACTWPLCDAEEWYEHGQRHRIGGPASTCADGSEEWYEYGVRIEHA